MPNETVAQGFLSAYCWDMSTLKRKQVALDAIAQEITHCRVCRRNAVGKAVPGEGNPSANVVFIGEAPGRQEAATGRPFVGRAGKILRGFIQEIGLREEDVYITSPVKFLPKQVTPTPAEVAHGRIHLFQQFDVIRPKIVVLLGRVASFAVLGRAVALSEEHGSVIEKDERRYFITYHPAAMLHSQKAKEPLREDFLKLKRLVERLT